MPIVSIRIPQMGEGLQEARLVAFLKKPGEKVKRDEPIYQMETDKAVMDVESPYEGVLVEWLTKEDVVLPIGTEIAKMEVAEGVREMPVGHDAPKKEFPDTFSSQIAVIEAPTEMRGAGAARNRDIPPKTRRYLKEKGLLDIAHLIPSKTQKLTPEDVDAYLLAQSVSIPTAPPIAAAMKSTADYEEFALSQRQRTLSYRLARGAQVCVPGTIMVECGWGKIEMAKEELKKRGGEFQPSVFTMMAWCVVQAMKEHPKFRSIMPNDNTLRTYKGVHLGIAVALPGDELVTAVVSNADGMTWREFAQAARQQIELARNGQDQATEATTLSITNMSAFGLLNAVPVVVSPAVATLFLGEPYWKAVPKMGGFDFYRVAMLSLTFDHRVINGVGAANFLNDVKKKIENFSLPSD